MVDYGVAITLTPKETMIAILDRELKREQMKDFLINDLKYDIVSSIDTHDVSFLTNYYYIMNNSIQEMYSKYENYQGEVFHDFFYTDSGDLLCVLYYLEKLEIKDYDVIVIDSSNWQMHVDDLKIC